VEEVSRRKEHLVEHYWRGELKMRAVEQLKKKKKNNNNNKNKTSFLFSGFSVFFFFFKISFCYCNGNISLTSWNPLGLSRPVKGLLYLLNCDVTMYVMQQEQLLDIPAA